MKAHANISFYNLVNILSLAILIPIQVLNFTLWFDSYYWLISDGDDAIVLLFWPLLLLWGIIALNRKMMRRVIHKENTMLYQANNINIDNEKDNGQIPQDGLEALPTSSIRQVRRTMKLDTTFFGELNDLGIKYAVDDFKYTLSYRRGDDTHYAYNLSGNALVVSSDRVDFCDKWVVFINHKVHIKSCKYLQPNYENINLKNKSCDLLYYDQTTAEQLDRIKKIINANGDLFGRDDDVIVLFKENMFIYITTKNHKFKVKLPFIIHKMKYDSIVSEQKAQVYRFNQFLTNISRVIDGSEID
ncbi:hypothetical protein R2F61_09320 [Mollicutes bacterium LVI A0078]|nr:hypothetical protein RZE84_09095 [Mollicutes bacterium LVI A0075]WOO90897.1 hypothetical protein R2F61_09320 [Mollicutes bacterium LVI A0078]